MRVAFGGMSLLLLLAACTRSPEAKRSATTPARSVASSVAARPPAAPSKFEYDQDGFVYARLQKTTAPVPARFSAPLPTSLEEFERTEAYPPQGQLHSALCNGDRDVAKRWHDAVRAAAKRGNIERPLREAFLELTDSCDSKPLCEWLAAAATTEPERGVREVLHDALGECGLIALPVLERDGSDEALIELYADTYWDELPLSPRVKQAVRAVVKKRKGKELRTLTLALARLKDDGLVAFVEGVRRPLDPESRAWLALAFHDQPRAEAQFREACERPELADELLCTPRAKPMESTGNGSFEQQVLDRTLDSRIWLAQHPDRASRLELALTTCVWRSIGAIRTDCLSDLAVHFWPHAHALVPRIGKASFEQEPHQKELASALARFATRDELVAHLKGLGFVPERFVMSPPGQRYEDEMTDAREVLLAAGRLHDFDAETDQFPNEHDALLSELAAMAGPELSGVSFEEVAPDPDGPRNERGEGEEPYLLRAYAGGQRYELDAIDYGDWYDVEAVLGLLNSLLRERGSSVRFLPLYTGDQTANVAVGKRDSLAQLVRDGLLAAAASQSARESGQAREREVDEADD
jgi:hypothetical protein